jgi:hypothetical protein
LNEEIKMVVQKFFQSPSAPDGEYAYTVFGK